MLRETESYSCDVSHTLKILIVDAERETRTTLMQSLYPLRRQGVEIFAAEDSEIALKMLESEQPDLILLDISMPGLNRFEMCRQIKCDENLQHTRIIMLAERSLCSARSSTLSGADDCIARPYTPDVILEHAQNALGMMTPAADY